MKISTLALLGLALCACRNTGDDDWDDGNEEVMATQGSTGKSSGAGSTTEASMRTSLSAEDRDFVTQAAMGGMFEVKSSELALREGVSDEARTFAQMMVEDHGKANRELESMATKKGLQMPVGLDSKHQAKLDELSRLEGAEFERAYLDAQKAGHDEAIKLFERASKECDDADLKAFATRTLPTLKKHRGHLDD